MNIDLSFVSNCVVVHTSGRSIEMPAFMNSSHRFGPDRHPSFFISYWFESMDNSKNLYHE